MKRNEFYQSAFSAKALFITGLLIIPALLFNSGIEYRVMQFLFFWLLAFLCGKKTNFIFTVLITLFIIAFNLIIPYGRVLFTIGAFKITSGALEAGIHRAVTLQALIMLSKVTIRQDLQLPGVFGKLLGESLQMFSVIMSRKYKVTGKNLIADIDSILLELSAEQTEFIKEQSRIYTKPAGYLILIFTVLIAWLPWYLNFMSFAPLRLCVNLFFKFLFNIICLISN
ncbi:MAG: hypothetical protein FWB77_02020 [Treponema sp.]|nr:hypothetical protein [Treponema sp.]